MRWLAQTINSGSSELKPPQNIYQLQVPALDDYISLIANPVTCMYSLDDQSVNYVQ